MPSGADSMMQFPVVLQYTQHLVTIESTVLGLAPLKRSNLIQVFTATPQILLIAFIHGLLCKTRIYNYFNHVSYKTEHNAYLGMFSRFSSSFEIVICVRNRRIPLNKETVTKGEGFSYTVQIQYVNEEFSSAHVRHSYLQ